MDFHPLPGHAKAVCALLLLFGAPAPARAAAADPAPLVDAALAAEARLESAQALALFLQADAARPDDPFILQNIAQQYSDLVLDQPSLAEKRRYAQQALAYAERAVALAPRNAINVLSVAISQGKLATFSDPRTKVRLSRLVKEHAERALALDPSYAWAHHVLGRWHHEVAALSGAERFFVGLFYGGLPPASAADAIRHLRRAVELDPAELNHHLELGFALAAAGRAAEAREHWERGLALPARGRHDEPAKQRARAALAAL